MPKQNAVNTTAATVRRELPFGRVPLSFEINRGQVGEATRFLSRGSGYTLLLTPSQALLVVTDHSADHQPGPPTKANNTQDEVIEINLLGANSQAEITGGDELPGKVSYFVGNDPTKWIRNIPTFADVNYRRVYRGIDLLFYGNEQRLESDFIVSPGADPTQIRLQFEGGERLTLSREGDLILQTPKGEVRLLRPHIYQDISGKRRDVAGHYVLRGPREIAFSLGHYNHAIPLVIDPVLEYSTALNGANFTVANGGGHGIAVDAAGNAYIAGYTDRSNFLPTHGSFTTASGLLFVSKLNSNGSAIDYTAVFGGTGSDVAMAVAVDAQGQAIVAGFTSSADFPTLNGLQSALPAGTHAFVTKLNAAGSNLLYSTLLGGSGATGVGNSTDVANGVSTDSSDAIYLTGYTNSTDFPSKNGVQPTCPDLPTNGYCNLTGFAAKLDPTQSGAAALLYSTYLGGNFPTFGQGIAVDGSEDAYITGTTNATDFPVTAGVFRTALSGGSDAFVSVLSPTGSSFIYSTYLGYGGGWGVAVDAQNNAYITGTTNAFGGSYPVTPGAFQTTLSGSITSNHAFVSKLNPTGTALVYSTYLGGSGTENGSTGNIAVDANGNAYISGSTSSSDFPTTADAVQPAFAGGSYDAFVTELNSSGTALIYSSYLGGSGSDQAYGIALDAAANVYLMGFTGSANFPTTPGAFETTVNTGTGSLFVAKIGVPTTSTALSASANPSLFGQPVTVTATVNPSGNSALTLTGTVTFTDGATALGTETLHSGTASLTTSSLIVGSHSIIAAYAGDANFAPSTSAAYALAVNQAGTNTALSVAPNPANFGQTVTLTAAVKVVAPGAGTPTGVITFQDGATVLATSPVDSAGGAAFSTSSLSSGTHSLSASYRGDTNFTVSSSTPLTLTVQGSVTPPPIQITDNETITVTDGELFPDVFDSEKILVSDAITITPLSGITTAVASFSAGTLGFTSQSGSQTLIVSDIGGAPLTLSSATISGSSQFTITRVVCSNGATSLSTALPSGGACTLTIGYSGSTTPANDTGALVFTDNAALSNLPSAPSGSSYTQSIALSGAGSSTPPPPPPPSIIPVTDNEVVQVTDTTSSTDVVDTEKITVTDQVTIQIENPLSFTSAASAMFTAGVPAIFAVMTSGLPIPSLSESGILPIGITFKDNGNGTATLAGTPAAGSGRIYSIGFNAHNGTSADVSQSFTLIVDQAPAISAPSNVTFYVGSLGSVSVSVTGFPAPTIAVNGVLPTGMSFDPIGGTLSGVAAPGSEGAYTVNFTATNGVGVSATATVFVKVTTEFAPMIASADHATFVFGLPAGRSVNPPLPFNYFRVTTTGIPVPKLTSKAPGFKDNGDGTGTISFSPTTLGMFHYTITATGAGGAQLAAVQHFTLDVVALPRRPTFSSADHTVFTIATPGSFTISAGPYVDQITASPLPAGITLQDNHDGTATLNGLINGTHTFTVVATNRYTTRRQGYVARQIFTLSALPSDESEPVITSVDHATFVFGLAAGGSKNPPLPYNYFRVTTTGIPVPKLTSKAPGFKDNGDGTGTISFSPTTLGMFHYTITATGAGGAQLAAVQHFTLDVVALPRRPTFSSADHTAFTIGTPGSFTVSAGPFVSKIEAFGLPVGIRFLDNHDGTATLSGTINSAQSLKIRLVASNPNTLRSAPYIATQTFTLDVLPSGESAPAITSADQTTFVVGLPAGGSVNPRLPYNYFKVTTTGIPVPKLTSRLLGLKDNGDGSATISFEPVVNSIGRAIRAIITATGAGGAALAATQKFTINVVQLPVDPTFTSLDHTAFTVGIPGSFTISAGPFVANIKAVNLPAGIRLVDNHNGTATLFGKVDVPQTYKITLVASTPNVLRVAPYTASQNFTLDILP